MRAGFAVLIALALSAPASAQSSRATCLEYASTVAELSTQYRQMLDAINAVPLGSLVNSLEGDQQQAALALNDAHQVMRPALQAYVERLEDLTYSLQTCLR
jgi:hypothetical protein